MPFGAGPAWRDHLVLTFESDPADVPTGNAPLSLGFEVVNDVAASTGKMTRSRALKVSLTDANGEQSINLRADTTQGLLKSGVLLIPAGGIAPVPALAGTTAN